MATIFAANESGVLVNGERVEGVRSIEYRNRMVRTNIYALGSAERIGLTSGPQIVEGRLTVASTSPALDELTGEQEFQISVELQHADTRTTVTFDECYLQEKHFNMEVGSHGEAVYQFTATRVREEVA